MPCRVSAANAACRCGQTRKVSARWLLLRPDGAAMVLECWLDSSLQFFVELLKLVSCLQYDAVLVCAPRTEILNSHVNLVTHRSCLPGKPQSKQQHVEAHQLERGLDGVPN